VHWRNLDKMSEGKASSRRRMFDPRELSLIIILSALGGGVSVPVGYAGNMLKSVPLLPLGTSQILSGVHVIWILLAGTLVSRRGSSTVTGVLKGLVELSLFSYHSVLVLLISAVEGVVMDLSFALLGRQNRSSIYLACGLSSMSNVAVLRLTILTKLPLPVIAYMGVLSFISGALFAGYLGRRTLTIAATLGLGQ
jgi:ABC-type thiamin/hydroxymethylpyrimidine transport system permease subunit